MLPKISLLGMGLIVSLLSGCQNVFTLNPFTENTPSIDSSAGSDSTSTALLAAEKLNHYCVSCHPTWIGYHEPIDWQISGLIVPGKPESSPFFTRLKYVDDTDSQMPLKFSALHKEFSEFDVSIFRSWIMEMAVEEISAPTAEIATSFETLSSNTNLRIADRFQMSSYFQNLFGPTSKSLVEANILTRQIAFSGSCDPYDPNDCATADGKNTSMGVIALSSTAREALRMKTCQSLVNNPDSLNFAIRKIVEKADLTYLNANPLPSKSEILRAYGIFNKFRAPPSNFLKALEDLSVEANNSRIDSFDPWRWVILSLCEAPDIQIH